MFKIKCCYKCEDRKINCHSSCGKYIQEKEEYDKSRELYIQQKKEYYEEYEKAERFRKSKSKIRKNRRD